MPTERSGRAPLYRRVVVNIAVHHHSGILFKRFTINKAGQRKFLDCTVYHTQQYCCHQIGQDKAYRQQHPCKIIALLFPLLFAWICMSKYNKNKATLAKQPSNNYYKTDAHILVAMYLQHPHHP